jgi:SynChlorMet cassette protein ScmC
MGRQITVKRSMGDSSSRTRYALNLGKGPAWSLTAGVDAEAWLNEFSSILGLRSGVDDGLPVWRFIRGKDGFDSSFDAGDRRSPDEFGAGWTCCDLNSIRVRFRTDERETVCELGAPGDPVEDILMMRDAFFVVYREIVRCGGLPLHAALVEKSGAAAAVAGPGGMGKSTFCRRLPASWNVLCDDESLVVPDGCGGLRAHPLPTWSDLLKGRSRGRCDIDRSVPLSAIFFLERGDSDKASPLAPAAAAARINLSAGQVFRRNLWDLDDSFRRELRGRIFNNACDPADEVPAFVLRTSRFGKPWERIEEILLHWKTVDG